MAATSTSMLLVFIMITCCYNTATFGAPTAKDNKLLTEGICSVRSILKNRYLHNLKGSSNDHLLDTTLELFKMAKGMIEYEHILGDLEDDGLNNTDVLTSRLMISSVMNHFCTWVTSALNENLDCTDTKSVLSFVTQMALLESVEKTCHTMKTYAQTYNEYSGVDHCKWMYCNFNPTCNPGISTNEMFNSLKRFVPSFCTILWNSHSCMNCINEGYIKPQPQQDNTVPVTTGSTIQSAVQETS